MRTTLLLLGAIVATTVAAIAFAGCGGDASAPAEEPLTDRLTRQAGAAASAPAAPPSSPAAQQPTQAATAATAAPSPDAATVLQVRTLGTLVLTVGDLPAGYAARTSQPAFKQDVVLAQVAIPKLANYFEDSTLRGTWASLFTHPGPPESGASSIIHLFETAEDARGLVDLAATIGAADYLSATEAQQLPPPQVGEAAALMRYTTTNGRSLELSWAQGPLTGQVILRWAAEAEPSGAVEQITALALVQAARMQTFLP